MPTVSLDEDHEVYADIDMADAYLDAAIHADAWRAATITDDIKGRALVTATRILDRQIWLEAYDTYEEREVVPAIISAAIEIALALVEGSTLQTQQSTAENIRSITAGSVSITHFRGVETAARFPNIVMELLRPFLGGSNVGGLYITKAEGVDGLTSFPINLGFTGGL